MELVLLPGLDGSGLLFGPLLRALGRDFNAKVISYSADLSLGYRGLTKHVLKRLPRESECILVAESFSGPIAHQLASRPPSNLKAVLFAATFTTSPRPLLLRLAHLAQLYRLARLPVPAAIIRRYLAGRDADSFLIATLQQVLRKTDPALLAHRLKAIDSLQKPEKEIHIPYGYIQAEFDRLVPKRCVDAFKELVPDLKVFQVAGPHLILQANPKECAEIIQQEI